MATFQVQVEDLTGTVSDTTALSGWLTDGARSVMTILPMTILKRVSSQDAFVNTIDVESKKVLTVTRNDGAVDHPCREVLPSMRGRITDSSYMEYASATDPAFYIDNQLLTVKPDSSGSNQRLTSINMAISVAFGDSAIANFPDEAENSVVLYAARNSLQRLMNDIQTSTTIDAAFVLMKAAVDQAETAGDKYESADESVFGDEATFTTASSQLTRVKAALDEAEDVINSNEPSATTDAYGAQANEDTELVTSALQIAQTEITRAQAHLSEWVAIGDMRAKEINSALAEAQGYGAEIQTRIANDNAKYTWYTQQYQMIDAQYKEQIQLLIGGGK